MQHRVADLAPLPFDRALEQARNLAESRIIEALKGHEGDVADAMRYAIIGGKGLRAFLVIEGARIFDVSPVRSAFAAGAIEALHGYSLIHDDLPCMDDDDLRRGKPTVHRKWSETVAVLAGDALQALAFELAAQGGRTECARADMVLSLARAAGISGMVGGQAMDIAAESADRLLDLDQTTRLQAGKTGALITWSACAGARMAGEGTGPLREYGDCLGLAFQIWDDVLDVVGDAQLLGKAVQKDAARGKATFVSHLGLEGAKARAGELIEQACAALDPYDERARCLRQAAAFVISRTN